MLNVGEISGESISNMQNYAENLTILAVDNNPVCLKYLVMLLHKCGYKVTETTRSTEAYDILRNNRDSYDILITNVRTNMDGFKLAELIINIKLDIPIVFVSANDSTELVKKVTMIAAEYIPKPIRYEDVKIIWKYVPQKDPFLKSKPRNEKVNPNPVRSLIWHTESTGENEAKIKAQVKEKEKKVQGKKQRITWTPEMHSKFVLVVNKLGIEIATPKKILESMNDPTLSRENVASHLQKYRKNLDKERQNADKKCQDLQKAFNLHWQLTLPCSNNQGIISPNFTGTNLNSYGTDVGTISCSQFSEIGNQMSSTLVNNPMIHLNQNLWPQHELEGMQVERIYSRSVENENNYFGSVSCFSGGYNPNGGPIPMSMPTNSLPTPPPISDHGQLEESNLSEAQRVDSSSWDTLESEYLNLDIGIEDELVAMLQNPSAPTL